MTFWWKIRAAFDPNRPRFCHECGTFTPTDTGIKYGGYWLCTEDHRVDYMADSTF